MHYAGRFSNFHNAKRFAGLKAAGLRASDVNSGLGVTGSCSEGTAIVHATLDRNARICHSRQTVCLIKAGKDSFRQVEIG